MSNLHYTQIKNLLKRNQIKLAKKVLNKLAVQEYDDLVDYIISSKEEDITKILNVSNSVKSKKFGGIEPINIRKPNLNQFRNSFSFR